MNAPSAGSGGRPSSNTACKTQKSCPAGTENANVSERLAKPNASPLQRPANPSPTLLARGVDWWEQSHEGQGRPETLDRLRSRLRDARGVPGDRPPGPVPVAIGPYDFSLNPGECHDGFYRLEGDGAALEVRVRGNSRRAVRLVVRCPGTWMLRHGRDARVALAFAADIVRAVLDVAVVGVGALSLDEEEATHAHVMREDQHADFEGLPPERLPKGGERWVGRLGPTGHGVPHVHHDDRTGRFSGLSLGSRSSWLTRIYNKTLELWQDDEKRGLERERWGERWTGGEVTRVEQMFRTELLEEVCPGRRPSQVVEQLDALWRMATKKRRLVRATRNVRKEERETESRWEVVQQVVFEKADAQPAKRRRKKPKPADAKRALSALLGFGVRRGLVRNYDLGPTEPATGHPQSAREYAEKRERAEREAVLQVHRLLHDAATAAAFDAVDTLRREGGYSATGIRDWCVDRIAAMQLRLGEAA